MTSLFTVAVFETCYLGWLWDFTSSEQTLHETCQRWHPKAKAYVELLSPYGLVDPSSLSDPMSSEPPNTECHGFYICSERPKVQVCPSRVTCASTAPRSLVSVAMKSLSPPRPLLKSSRLPRHYRSSSRLYSYCQRRLQDIYIKTDIHIISLICVVRTIGVLRKTRGEWFSRGRRGSSRWFSIILGRYL